ncbi:MAG: T9SS type A sorting domain-containing protein [Bacteroidetes bacterium]|nr:T9SS type A sorting domain-containing protein [Bacteroidota bacterium]
MLTLGAADDIDYQNFYTASETAPIGKFEQVSDLINSDNVATATSVNSAVAPTTVMETNRKTVNAIYLQTFASGSYELESADESTLLAIANLDPLIDGDAVYSARAMLRIDPTDNSTVRSMETEEEETIQENTLASKVYPNPNNGVMQMDYTIDEESTGTLIIYDLTGRKLNAYTLTSGTNTLQIDESKLESGIYFYQIIVNNEMIESDKIVIVK